MSTVRIAVDGREMTVERGVSVAAAMLNGGVSKFRTSVRGEPRAPLCAMGICHECRVTIDGVSHRRSCLIEVAEGMQVDTQPSIPYGDTTLSMEETLETEIVVIGAGPAGIAAAVHASECGAEVVVIDESARLGGQIWRHRDRSSLTTEARGWIQRFELTNVQRLHSSTVSHVVRGLGRFAVTAEQHGRAITVHARAVIIATGARERFLPFPGSTLPNVVGVGAAQALLKSGLDVRGKRVVIAGSGPLLLPVAAMMAAHGARLALVAEQAPLKSVMRFSLGLWRHPSAIGQAVRYRSAFMTTRYATGNWVTAAHGTERVEEADVTDGHSTRTLACDLLCVAHGLVANTELARQLGCTVEHEVVLVDVHSRASVEGVFCAGELTGVGGMELALEEGAIAGLTAAGHVREASRRVARLRPLRSIANGMNRAFTLRSELRALATQDTIVCRCEDVPVHAITKGWTLRKTKLYTRAGMGACQGRVCGAALQFLHGEEADTVRLPVQPVRLTTLAAGAPPAAIHDHGD